MQRKADNSSERNMRKLGDVLSKQSGSRYDKLVSTDGVIKPMSFDTFLTAWHSYDPKGVFNTQPGFRPMPPPIPVSYHKSGFLDFSKYFRTAGILEYLYAFILSITGSRFVSWGTGVLFSKNFRNRIFLLFSGRSNRFSELSKYTTKTLLDPWCLFTSDIYILANVSTIYHISNPIKRRAVRNGKCYLNQLICKSATVK